MPRINVFIADPDKFYAESLGKFISSAGRNYNVSTFTSLQTLESHISNCQKKPDILLVSEDFDSSCMENFKTGLILTTDKSLDTAESCYLHKYKSAEKVLEKVNSHMENLHPSIYKTITGNTNTRVISIVSPDGGSGKSVLSFHLATEISQSGSRVLLLDLQSVNSLSCFTDLQPDKPGLSDLFYYIKSGRENLKALIENYIFYDTHAGIYYIPPLTNPMELEELSPDDLEILINSLKSILKYDIIIIDTDSMINLKTAALIDCSDAVLLVSRPGPIESKKLLACENSFKRLYEDKDILKQALFYISNCSGNSYPPQTFNGALPVLQIPCTDDVFLRQQDSWVLNQGSCIRPYISKICRLIDEKISLNIYR